MQQNFNLFSIYYSERLYERVLDVSTSSDDVEYLVSVTRKLGYVRNELGLFHMNTAVNTTVASNEIQEILKKSLDAFTAGIRAFEAVDDRYDGCSCYKYHGCVLTKYVK